MTIKQILQEKGVDAALEYIYKEIEGRQKEKKEMIHEIAKLAIEPAESVLHIFEREYPNDNRPRRVIEAAKRYFEEPSEENANIAANIAATDTGQYIVKYVAWAAVDAACATMWDSIVEPARAAVRVARAVEIVTRRGAWDRREDEEEAEQEMKEKIKEIILKYFN